MGSDAIVTKTYGQTGQKVTLVGLGGEDILRTYGQTHDAPGVTGEASGQGLTYQALKYCGAMKDRDCFAL